MRNIVTLKENLTRGRLDHPSQEIDQRRLAGPVRSDQRLSGARLNRERHTVGRDQRAEMTREATRLERRSAHAAPRPTRRGAANVTSRFGAPAIRSLPASTRMTKANPIQNSQYSGVAAEITSRSTMSAAAPIRPP